MAGMEEDAIARGSVVVTLPRDDVLTLRMRCPHVEREEYTAESRTLMKVNDKAGEPC